MSKYLSYFKLGTESSLGIMIMTRNTNGEMWHLKYNPGFHSIAGQIEHSNKLDH